MRILNFGSLNIDHVFSVAQIAKPGQTVSSDTVEHHPGGKGFNQSLALARAGADVWHAGLIGLDGLWLRDLLERDGVRCENLFTIDANTGCAFIQVERSGQNCIVLDGGANQCNSVEICDRALKNFGAGDILLLQNEINLNDYLIKTAHKKNLIVVLNPSPMNEKIGECDLSLVDWFIMNENEGQDITGAQDAEGILNEMKRRYSKASVVLTMGEAGSIALHSGVVYRQEAYTAHTIDTTGAGDTFTGYFLALLSQKSPIKECLRYASKAASIAVTRKGAGSSIPYMKEVLL